MLVRSLVMRTNAIFFPSGDREFHSRNIRSSQQKQAERCVRSTIHLLAQREKNRDPNVTHGQFFFWRRLQASRQIWLARTKMRCAGINGELTSSLTQPFF